MSTLIQQVEEFLQGQSKPFWRGGFHEVKQTMNQQHTECKLAYRIIQTFNVEECTRMATVLIEKVETCTLNPSAIKEWQHLNDNISEKIKEMWGQILNTSS